MNPELATVIEKAHECQQVCNMCFDACLKEDDVKMLVDCIQLDRECADICAMVATFASREGAVTTDLISLCATICQACAKECEKHTHMEHCQKCAEACFECARVCREYVA